MAVNIGVCISFLIVLVIILTYYNSKDKINNLDNRCFKKLVPITIFGLIIEAFIYFYAIFTDEMYILNIFVKLLYIYYVLWMYYFVLYGFVVFFDFEDIDDKKYKSLKKVLTIFYIIFFILSLVLPVEIELNDTYIYPKGVGTTFQYLAFSIGMACIMICGILNRKNFFKKQSIPLISSIVFGIICTVIQVVHIEFLFIVPSHAIAIVMMYFTIENPDLAMIEQLNIARDQADRANQSKSEFLSSMSHEIRTPLNAIVGFSQALQEENLPEQAEEEVKDIVRASESLLELVNGILDISKIEANKIEIVNGEYNIYEVLNDLVALSKARMGDKKLDFKPIFDKSIPPILYGDAVRVKQIILNLLTNAIKYTKEGEVIFRVSSIQNNSVCRLIISVEDTGIGIKKENIDQLFDKFQRLDLEKNKTIEGTGLGLAITKRLVDLMNGRIMVQSVYGKGSKFTVALDQGIIHKAPEQIKIENENNSSDIRDLTGKKVLIVDDNKLNLKVASRLIEKYNCEIKTIESGFECIDLIKSGEQFDIILMDDMMSNMSGVETFHKLKEIENFNIPVIALTANAISGMREKYLEEGFNDYLSKPIDKMELNKILNTYIKN
ncbi:MAG: response regulator [Bacilli bacterium]|nr:response regulator [Bacilli bacterium]